MTSEIGGVRLRAALEDLPHYVPGAGGSNASVFKLSSNELPGHMLPAVTAAVIDAAEDANRYPQMYADRLTEAIADRHDLMVDQVLVGNGSVALIELLLRSMCADGDQVVYPWRSFEAYPILVQVTGADGVQVPLRADGGHDLAAMAEAITGRTRVVLLCSPNNPTSAAMSHADLVAFLDRVPRNIMVILDEAYVDFVRSPDPIDSVPLLQRYKNLVVLRTFSKAYGLAGLRVGYALARRRLVRALRTASTPFGVNSLAQVAAVAALNQREAVSAAVDEIVSERDRVVSALREQGWQIPEPQGNFYWLPVGDRALALAEDAAASGVMVRPFAGHGVRVTVAEAEANDIALSVASRWVSAAVRR
ncbi:MULTISPECIES: histidinol-phosphate transaminase [unclassified Pseudactinotalea]|uniref:histidinol-phosphate transaminase n=1 Tax=Micrococcales TaxID=85006 RepID=UPI003C7E64A3